MNLSLYSRLIFLFCGLFVLSCTKIITTDIGSDLIPPADGVVTKDTVLVIKTKNAGFDSVYVGISDDHMLGYIGDEIFGKTTASVNFQVAPDSYPFSWGINKANIVLDSVVLCLKNNGVWGDSNQAIKLHVYTIDPEVVFDDDSAYDNTRKFQKAKEISELPSGTTVYPVLLNDVDTTKGFYTEVATNQIRIRLNNTFGQQLIGYDSATVYKNDTTFYSYLRGLIVEPEQTGHSLMQVSLTDTSTRLAVYYHASNDTLKLTRRFTPHVSTAASSNTILRDYTGTDIPGYISNGSAADDKIYMQTSPGTHATLDISALDNMPNVIVHRAEVLMYEIPDADSYLTPPKLFLAASSDSGFSFAIPYDVTIFNGSVTNLNQFGVNPLLKDGNYYYSFDISRYVQGIITRKEKRYNLVLTAPYNQSIFLNEKGDYYVPISSPALNKVATGRILLGGGNNSEHTMRLHIVYSLP